MASASGIAARGIWVLLGGGGGGGGGGVAKLIHQLPVASVLQFGWTHN